MNPVQSVHQAAGSVSDFRHSAISEFRPLALCSGGEAAPHTTCVPHTTCSAVRTAHYVPTAHFMLTAHYMLTATAHYMRTAHSTCSLHTMRVRGG